MKNTLMASMACGLIIVVASIAWQTPHWRLYSVQTGSMGLALPKGSLILVRRNAGRLPIGTIATYRHPMNEKTVVTHRVTAYDTGTDKYVFKGDTNAGTDIPVPATNLIGPVSAHLQYAGYICTFLKTPLGLILGVYLPASLIIIYEVSRLAYQKRSYRLNT